MINTISKNNNKFKLFSDNLLNDIYLLPKWEKIKSFSYVVKKFFFFHNGVNIDLFRRFSAKNCLEKYSLQLQDGTVVAGMDLRIYKDCVYIINLNIKTRICNKDVLNTLIQTAAEKALYNTTNKELKINLALPLYLKSKVKKVLLDNDFYSEDNQSDYEKEMFGETFCLKVEKSSSMLRRIKTNSILIDR